MSARQRIDELSIAEQRCRETPEGIIVGTSFGAVSRLLAFLEITAADYEAVNTAYLENAAALDAALSKKGEGTFELTPTEQVLFARNEGLSTTTHLRIETFYVVAKILLDRVGLLLEVVFGQGRAASLAKHSKLRANLGTFAAQKGLSDVPASLLQRIEDMEERIVQYRDWYVTHDQSPRAVRGTSYRLEQGAEARIHAGRAMPKDGEGRISRESETPRTLMPFVDGYVTELADYIASNLPDPAAPFGSESTGSS